MTGGRPTSWKPSANLSSKSPPHPPTKSPPKPPQWYQNEARIRDTLRKRLDPVAPLNATPSHIPSDYDLNPGMRDDENHSRPLRAAAVLIPIYFNPEPMVLFTKRTQQLQHHPGQISFPGGKIDERDSSPQHAALREAHEELGLEKTHIEPLGFLNSYETRTGFLIKPLVALLKPGFELKPDTNEVAEYFYVPLSYLMNRDHHQKHAGTLNGKTRYYYALSYKTRYIWGATAGILVNMHERLHG